MRPILAGTETEYGFWVEDKGAADQVSQSAALVRDFSGGRLVHWDDRFESPRSDLRGFRLEHLLADPTDAQFDKEGPSPDVRGRFDRVLENGARFYNDHGHPEYATPESWSSLETALHDAAGERIVLRAANEHSQRTGREVRIYKNNVDYHGASYGSHESYSALRSIPFPQLYEAVTPILIARTYLCGAGRVGAEQAAHVHFQLSQRADFLTESANAETLFRRPVFNTRDEPHADPSTTIRLHVIAGDANMMAACTARKLELVKIALWLLELGRVPLFPIKNPARAMTDLSHSQSAGIPIELDDGSSTTPREILTAYLAEAELAGISSYAISECRELLLCQDWREEQFRSSVEWAAKQYLLESFVQSEGVSWTHPTIQAFDLEYHDVHPERSLYHGLAQIGAVIDPPADEQICPRTNQIFDDSRALARWAAINRLSEWIQRISWSTITFGVGDRHIEVFLDPLRVYPESLRVVSSVEEYCAMIGQPGGPKNER